jgi:hypothetical protein
MLLSPSQVECLLMALLAVNNFSLEKAWGLLPRMRETGLTDPARVVAMNTPVVVGALTGAGYDRKRLTWLFAERVKALMHAIQKGDLAGLAAAVAACDEETATRLLLGVRGVGPRVAENAWALLSAG